MTAGWNRYGPTAARAHGKPGRLTRPKTVTIDVHGHVGVPRAFEYVKPHFDWSTIPLAHFATPETRALNEKQEADRASRMNLLPDRLADLDEMGVDRQVILPAPIQCYYTVPLEVAVRATQMVNDGIAEYAAQKPDRLIPFGSVPLQDGRAAVEELTRCVKKLGFKGVEILTNVAGRELSDPACEPFWTAAEELQALVVMHPNGFTEGRRLTRHYFNNVIGNPFDTTVALHYLVFDGVLERHPRLRILALHGGGYLCAYSGRIDHAWGAREDARAALPKPPGSYLRNVFVDTVVFTPHQLRYLVEQFGADHVLMGTDYPYDMAEYDPVGHVRSVEGFDESTVEAITGGNLRGILKL